MASFQAHCPSAQLNGRRRWQSVSAQCMHTVAFGRPMVHTAAGGGGFGPQKKAKAKPVNNTPTKTATPTKPQPIAAPKSGQLVGTATASQLTDGLWNDVVDDVAAFFEKAGKDVKAVTLQAGKVLVLYKHKGVVYCSDVNSTAFQFPMVDAKVVDTEQGPTVEVPLDGTVYDLRTGKVLKWCPNNDNAVRNFFATIKDYMQASTPRRTS